MSSPNPDVTERLSYRLTNLAVSYDAIRALPVAVLLDDVRSAYNVGAFFRTLDAVGGGQLHLCGFTARPPHSKIAKTALGAEATVAWEGHESSLAAMDRLRSLGWSVAAVETSIRAVDLFEWQPAFPVCVAFGHEVDGLRPEILDSCDIRVRIPMLGSKHSLNVATAGGVVLYELLRKYRTLIAARR